LKLGMLSHRVLSGWWTDAGTFDSIARATALVEGKDDSVQKTK
jgi:hypothetical protein